MMLRERSQKSQVAVFDSGFGGLSVLKALVELLPCENILYFADTAHLPYGNKGGETIIRYCQENALFLQTQDIKLLVIACNTACSFALSIVRNLLDIPVIGITEQGIADVLQKLPRHRVGILGTRATIASELYQRELSHRSPFIKLFPVACPLFVPLVEEGYANHQVTQEIAKEYLSFINQEAIDGLLLACTHYPLLIPLLQTIVGPDVLLIDPSFSCARETKAVLETHNLLNPSLNPGKHEFVVSDDPEQFRKFGTPFFPYPITQVRLIPTPENKCIF